MVVLLALLLTWRAADSDAATVFSDGFESGAINSPWSVSGTNNGRVEVNSAYTPATGSKHLLFDDSVNDALYSVAEATLTLDLSNKKNVVLSFNAKSIGNEPDPTPSGNFTSIRNYDGVGISTDGGTTWRIVRSLATVSSSWQSITVGLDSAVAALGGTFGSDFRIRFSEYDNAPAPLDGIAIDDVLVTADENQRVVLELPNTLVEGSGVQTGYALLTFAAAQDTTVFFSVSPGQLVFPASVVIPAGSTFASFTFTVPDDALVNLDRTVTVTPIAPAGFGTTPSSVVLQDNETPPTASLTLPSQVTEGITTTNNASLTLNFAAAVPITFSLSSNPSGELTLPSTVTIPAGQTLVFFSVQAYNDTVLDGNILVTMTASGPLAPATAQTTTIDNEIPALSLSLPATLLEGTGGTGTATISGTLPSALTVYLSSSSTATLAVPASVTIPAGQTSATFALTAVNDSLVNLTRQVTISASGTGVTATTGTMSVLDDETPPVATLTLPAKLTEGEIPSNNAVLSLSFAPANALTVSLSASPTGEISIPSSVTIPAGQTQVTFTAQASNDSRIDGDIVVTVTASSSSIATTTAQTTTVDNETRQLSLTLPTTIQEGATTTGTVSISGTLTVPLTVTLSNSDPASLTVPNSVTISAGSTQATFSLAAPDNAARDGTRVVAVGAASSGFVNASRTIPVRDNEVAGYRVSALTDIVNINAPATITVSAADVEGNAISGFNGAVNLSLVLPDGSTQALTPATAVLTGTSGWTGAVTLPSVNASPLHLRASDGSGNSGDSNDFDLLRTLNLIAADLLWDATRSRIYASVPATAGGAYANQVVAIDPATLQITGSVTTNQDPGQIVMTSGGEYLYVALNSNGTIAKINPATMTVLSTFAVGTDPYYGTLYAEDMCAVSGQPNVLIVAQKRKSVSPRHNGVAAYDNGVIRPLKTQDHTGSNLIEPSSDPTIFFGQNIETTEFGFRRLQLGPSGMTQLTVDTSLVSGFSADIRSDGNKVFTDGGVAVDGTLLKRLGSFATNGPVRPDLASGRVYFVEPQSTYSSTYARIGAFDAASFALIRRLTMPAVTSPASFIRWGANGLAFRTASTVTLISSSRLVPSDPPADLAVKLLANPNPATVGAPLTYTITARNNGPNIAHHAVLNATLSDSQTIQSSTASSGAPVISGSAVNVALGDLTVGASATLTIVANPQSAGSLSCTTAVSSDALDPNFADNVAFKLVSVSFQVAIDAVNQLRLTANNLIYDPLRDLLWASIPATVDAPLGRSVVSIDPHTGLISDPIPINANPTAACMALSANGRYLYVGLSDVSEVHRLDLSTSPVTSVRIPLGTSQWGSANFAEDVEVLDGDGTSFLMASTDDHAAAVFDSSTGRRTNRTAIYSVDRIERTSTAGIFIGYDNYTSGFETSRLSVTAAGVSVSQSVSNLISGYYLDIRGAGNLLLSSGGNLIDSTGLTLKANLGLSGRPCVDPANQRAYLVNGNGLRAFDAATGAATGTLALPTTATGDWAQTCVRWGLDGFAILGGDGQIYIARWSATIPPAVDQNNDGFTDAWSAANFGTLAVNPQGDPDGDGIPNAFEYLFATSPLQSSINSTRTSTSVVGGQTFLHLTFPRRVGLAAGSYGYEGSQTLGTWSPIVNASEKVLSTQTIGGVLIETVDATIPCPSPDGWFVRLKWIHP